MLIWKIGVSLNPLSVLSIPYRDMDKTDKTIRVWFRLSVWTIWTKDKKIMIQELIAVYRIGGPKMDYQKEVSELMQNETKADWYKPTVGKHKIEILEEPIDVEKTFDGEVRKQIRLAIRAEGMEHTWDIGKGETRASLYGQLMLLGNLNKRLKGVTFNLNVTSDGKKNSYSIDEVLPLMALNK